jgi:uncharacterized LabA/DUF88 family protein
MVFIDGSNLYHVLTQICGRHDLRFGKFVEKLTAGRDLVRGYYYNVRQDRAHSPAAAQDQDRFLASLDEVPYLETKLGIHKQRGVEMVEKGVDVMIATDLVSGAFKNLYDTAILVSGDGDFFPAIEAVKDLGKHVEVVAFEDNLSPEAERAADVTTLLRPSYFTGLWTTSRSRGGSRPQGATTRQRTGRGDGGDRDGGDSGGASAGEEAAAEAAHDEPGEAEPEAADRGAEPAEPRGRQGGRGERRRFGRRRRGPGAGGEARGGGDGGGDGRASAGETSTDAGSERREPVPGGQRAPEPETSQPGTPQPRPPQRRPPLRPPPLRNVPPRPASEPSQLAQRAAESGGDGAPGQTRAPEEAAVARANVQPGRRLGWLRRRLSQDRSEPWAGTGDASPSPAG